MDVEDISYAQRQRLAFIDFCLLFQGHIARNELLTRFEVGLSAATRDFNLYKSMRADNLVYSTTEKRYFQTKSFKPLFEHDSKKILLKLANRISDGFDGIQDIQFPVDSPGQINVPDVNVVARVIQAILNQKAVSIIYTSLSSGSGAREVVPHAVIDNGLRWHVRAWDRKSKSFRDFVMTRISKVSIKDRAFDFDDLKDADEQWQRTMTLELVPHPKNVKHSQAIELDYGMTDGVLALDVRSAMAGYLLRRWNVDCSVDASLRGPEYQLWLRNRQTLLGAQNLVIAPGYEESERLSVVTSSSE